MVGNGVGKLELRCPRKTVFIVVIVVVVIVVIVVVVFVLVHFNPNSKRPGSAALAGGH